MTARYSTIGNRNIVEVTTLAQLKAAFIVAKSGTVIRQTAVDPDETALNRTLTFSSPKGRAGVSVQLHPSQTVKVIFSGGMRHNVELVYGRISADDVNGNATSSEYGVTANAGASHFAVRGAVLGQSNKLFAADQCSDFEVTDCLLEWTRVDGFQIVRSKRYTLARLFGRDTTIKSRKMRWFTGSEAPKQPVDDANNSGSSDAGPINWVDADHSDLVQIRNVNGSPISTDDVAVIDCDVWMQGAGIVCYGDLDSNGYLARRMLIAGNKVRTTDNGAIFAIGEDVEVRDNEVGTHPVAGRSGTGTLGITVLRKPDGAQSKARGGRNTLASTGDASFDGALGFVDPTDAPGMLQGSSISGDVVLSPVLPQLEAGRLGWATKNIVRPAFVAYNGKPVLMPGSVKIYHTSQGAMKAQTRPAAVVGSYGTGNLGKVKGNGTETYEVVWRRGSDTGEIISTTRIYQFQAADVGVGVVYGVRPTNTGGGVGDWLYSAVETVVAA